MNSQPKLIDPGQISAIVNARILDYQTIEGPLSTVYGTIKYGRNTAPTKTSIYSYL